MANLGAINNPYTGGLTTAPGANQPSPADMQAYLQSIGGNSNEALMLTGAAANESGLDPTKTHDGGIGYGMFGHNGSRLMGMKQFATQSGQPLSDWHTQAQYALQELRSRPEGKAVANATTPEQLALAQMYYEQPKGFTPSTPEEGHNYTGRLNTIKSFTALNPNATGAFASSANPQVSPSSVSTAAPGAAVTQPAAASIAPSVAAAPSNAFSNVGNPQLNAALAKILQQSQAQANGTAPAVDPSKQPLISQLVSPVTAPIKQAIGQGLGGIKGSLSGLLGGGSAAADAAQDAAQDAPDYAPQPLTATGPSLSSPPLVAPQPAQGSASNQAIPPQGSALPTSSDPNFLSSLSSLFGGGSAGA